MNGGALPAAPIGGADAARLREGGIVQAEPCTCIADLDAAAAEHNTRIATTIRFGTRAGEASIFPTILTEKIDQAKRGRPFTIIPSFCPFCGVRLDAKDAPAPAEGSPS